MKPHEPFHDSAADSSPLFGMSQAPQSMLTGLQSRLEAYQQVRSALSTAEEFEEALRDPRWEIRCAAADHLSAQSSRAAIERVLNDEDYSVRLAAVRALGRMGLAAPIDLLERGLHDLDWQVRELTLLTADEFQLALSTSLIEKTLHDESAEVRRAARSLLDHRLAEQENRLPLPFSLRFNHVPPFERKQTSMSIQTLPELTTPIVKTSARRRWLTPLKAFLMVASLLIVMGTLTAASFAAGWWPSPLGNPTQYTPINKVETINGVTVELLYAYIDEGHVIIVSDITKSPAHAVVGPTTITDSYVNGVPMEEEGFYKAADPQNSQIKRTFWVFKALKIPSNVDNLTITWSGYLYTDVLAAMKNPPVYRKDINSKIFSGFSLFSFTFSAPFHHVDDRHIASLWN